VRRELRDIATAVGVASGALLVAGTWLGFHFANPAFITCFALATFLGLSVERRTLRFVASRLRRAGRNLRNVVLIGTGDDTLELTAKLAQRDDLGYNVIDIIDVAAGEEAVLQRVEAHLGRQPIDEVFVAVPIASAQQLIQKLVVMCEEQGITFRFLASLANLSWARARIDTLEGEPVLTVYTGPPDTVGLALKRLVDVIGASVAIVLFAPLFALTALLIKLDSPGPVFFRQKRVGINRRQFHALKFRTMVVGAEEMQPALESLNEADGPVFKIANDPRVTRLGRWLRKLSIDELPQFFNVLKGEMSLVGPRPLPLRDVSRIAVRWHNRRFSVKPGITCLWQVTSREPKFDEWIRSDMEYIDNWSLGLDFKILFKTIPAVLSGQGAV
jgi:exopolysaccharide biosynthesis polyprenyl glycosylphosphotransferase